MSVTADVLNSLVSITQFNKGQAAKIFDRVKTERHLVVLKNNLPSAVILSPDEYARISEIEENYNLLLMAEERLSNGSVKNAVSEAEAMNMLGLSNDDIANAEDVTIE